MSSYTDGIKHTIDVIQSALDGEAIDELPTRVILSLLVSSLYLDIEEM